MPPVGASVAVSRLIARPHNGAAIASAAEQRGARRNSDRSRGPNGTAGVHQHGHVGVASSAWHETSAAPPPATGGSSSRRSTLGRNSFSHNNNNNVVHKDDVRVRGSYPQPVDSQPQQMSAYRRWLAKNKVGQSQPYTFQRAREAAAAFDAARNATAHSKLLNGRDVAPKYRESPGAAAILYLGLGMMSVGLVITIVGLGDSVFPTLALQLIGPTMVCLGVIICAVRVLFCFCADRCQLCDRPVDYSSEQRKSASLKSWRPDSRSVVKDSGKPTSSTTSATFRPPTAARITLQSGERRLYNMAAAGSGINGRPVFTSPTPSFQDFSSSSSSSSCTPSGPGIRPGSTSPDLSLVLSSLQSDDIGNLLNEFKEIELEAVSPPHHLVKIEDPASEEEQDLRLETNPSMTNVTSAFQTSSAGSWDERKHSCTTSESDVGRDVANGELVEVHAGKTEVTSPELEVQRFLQMELQKVFQSDTFGMEFGPERDQPEVIPRNDIGRAAESAETTSSVTEAQDGGVRQAEPDVTFLPDAEMERYLTGETDSTEMEEIIRESMETDTMVPEAEMQCDGLASFGSTIRETELKRVLESAEMDRVLQEAKLSKVPLLAESGETGLPGTPKTVTRQISSRSKTPILSGDSTRDLNSGILLNPTALLQTANGGSAINENRKGQ